MDQNQNKQNQQNQQGFKLDQIKAEDLVRIDVTGGDPQAKRTIVSLLSRMLKDQLPDTNIQVLSQDQQIKTDLDTISQESGSLPGSEHLHNILVISDESQQFQFGGAQDPLLARQDLQQFFVPMGATAVSHERSRQFVEAQQSRQTAL